MSWRDFSSTPESSIASLSLSMRSNFSTFLLSAKNGSPDGLISYGSQRYYSGIFAISGSMAWVGNATCVIPYNILFTTANIKKFPKTSKKKFSGIFVFKKCGSSFLVVSERTRGPPLHCAQSYLLSFLRLDVVFVILGRGGGLDCGFRRNLWCGILGGQKERIVERRICGAESVALQWYCGADSQEAADARSNFC